MRLISFILIVGVIMLSSCSVYDSKINFDGAHEVINLHGQLKSIQSYCPVDHIVWINGNAIAIDSLQKAKYLGAHVPIMFDDFLNQIKIQNQSFDTFHQAFLKSNAHAIDFKDGYYYFMMDSFLDDSKGMMYTANKIPNQKNGFDGGIKLNDNRIHTWTKVSDNWYEVMATN